MFERKKKKKEVKKEKAVEVVEPPKEVKAEKPVEKFPNAAVKNQPFVG